MQVIKENIITVNDAYELLKERQKEGNLSYEQQNTLNYLEDLIKLDNKEAKAMVKELSEAGLTQWQAVKVTDLLPKKEDELKLVLAGTGPVNEAELKKVFEIVKKYKKDSKEPAKTRKVEAAPAPVAEEVAEKATDKTAEASEEKQEQTE